MYGMRMEIEHNDQKLIMRPFKKSEMGFLAEKFESMKFRMFMGGLSAPTKEDQEERHERTRNDLESFVWALAIEGRDDPIGVTSLSLIDPIINTCTSGGGIFSETDHKKGYMGAFHRARLMYATDFRNILTIRSLVKTANPDSVNALLKAGYSIWGTEPRTAWRAGHWLDTYHLIWIHPEKIEQLYPEGVPEIFKKGIDKARTALEWARKNVIFP